MWVGFLSPALLHASAWAALLAPPQQEPRRLDLPLPEQHFADVVNALIAPGGARVVYVDSATNGLFSVPSDGSAAPIRLGGNVAPVFQFDPLGSRVLYRAPRVPDGSGSTKDPRILDLYSAPIDGSAPAVFLDYPVGEGALGDFRVALSGARVVFRSLNYNPGPAGLYSSPITGLLAGASVETIDSGGIRAGVTGFRILPDSTQVVYRSDRSSTPQATQQLFRAPLKGGATPVLLSGPQGSAGEVEPEFELVPDGSSVVYRADQGLDGTLDLLAAPTSAGLVRKLSAASVPGGDVHSFLVSPDGARVVYAGEEERAGVRELYCARIDGAAPPLRLSGFLTRGGMVREGYVLDARGQRVLFRTSPGDDACTLDSAPIDRSAPVELVGPLPGRDAIADDFRFTSDGTRAVFRADPDGDHVFDLFSVASAGFAPRVELGHAVLDFELGPGFVLFRAEETPGIPELFAARLDGSRAPVRVHPPLPFGHATLARYELASDGRLAIYLADPNLRGVFELFRVGPQLTQGPLQLSADGVRERVDAGSVQDFVLVGERALYRAPQELEDVVGLYSVPLDGSAPPLALSPPCSSAGGVLTRDVTSDGARVVFVQGGEHGRRELYGAAVDGHSPTVRLDAPAQPRCDVEPRFVLTPDGQSALYVADQEQDETAELYRVALDGPSAPVRLHPPLRPGRSVKATFQVTPDGTRVAFASDLRVARRFELYVAPLDGSAAPLRLSQKTNGGGDVRAITLTRDGSTALYLADQEVDERFELWSVPLDGSQPARRLNDALIAAGDVSEYALDPTGTWVLYLADQTRDETRGLYAVPLDGSAAPRNLAPQFSFTALVDVGSFRFTPDGRRVVFLAAVNGIVYSPYCAPLDGSQPARLLDARHLAYLPNWDYRITPDGSRLVYRLKGLGLYDERLGLFSVPLDGSHAPVVLNVPLALAEPFVIAADSRSVVYAGRILDQPASSLFRVPIDGPREASVELVSVSGGDTRQIELSDQKLFWIQRDLYSFRPATAPFESAPPAPLR